MALKFTVYEFYGDGGIPLYVGVTRDFNARHATHKNYANWYSEMAGFTLWEYDDAKEAAIAEAARIVEREPIYNMDRKGWGSASWATRVKGAESRTGLTLRLVGNDEDLHKELKAWAKAEDRSLHSLIIWILRRAVQEWR